jgi:prepilin-type N-terminal cleavage/methylation domain-containing protein
MQTSQQDGKIAASAEGFTLIELLVVVAIIAILASLLLPAMARAKYSGSKSQCISNIRQQYLSQIMYADDFRGKFPPHTDVSPGLPPHPGDGQPEHRDGDAKELRAEFVDHDLSDHRLARLEECG